MKCDKRFIDNRDKIVINKIFNHTKIPRKMIRAFTLKPRRLMFIKFI